MDWLKAVSVSDLKPYFAHSSLFICHHFADLLPFILLILENSGFFFLAAFKFVEAEKDESSPIGIDTHSNLLFHQITCATFFGNVRCFMNF